MENYQLVILICTIVLASSVLIGGIGFIIKWCFGISVRLNKLEDNFKVLPEQIESRIMKGMLPYLLPKIKLADNPLTKDEIKTRNYLLDKLVADTISIDEAKELQTMIKKEEMDLRKNSKYDSLLGIGVVLTLLGLKISSAVDK